MSLQDAVAESFLEHGVSCHAPSSATVVRDVSPRGWDFQSSQSGFAPASVMPPKPEAFPDVAAYPAAQFSDVSPFLGSAVVGPPPALIVAPCVAQLLAAQ